MARLAGVDLPRNKRMEIALTYIYGIGKALSRSILKEADVSLDKRTDALDDNETRRIREVRAHGRPGARPEVPAMGHDAAGPHVASRARPSPRRRSV